MPEVYYHRREISYEHLKALLSKLSSADFGDLRIFSYGSTFTFFSNIRALENTFESGVNLLYGGPMFGGLMRLIPLPKARVFSFEVKDHSKIRDLFFALNEFLWIYYLFVSEVDYDKVKRALSSNHVHLSSAEGILTSGFVVFRCIWMRKISMTEAELQNRFLSINQRPAMRLRYLVRNENSCFLAQLFLSA